jgi:hypothetical protein
MSLRSWKMGLALSASVLIGGCVSTTRQPTVTSPQVINTVPVSPTPIGPAAPFPQTLQPGAGLPPGAVLGPPPTGQPCPNCGPAGQQPMQPMPQTPQPPGPIVIPTPPR